MVQLLGYREIVSTEREPAQLSFTIIIIITIIIILIIIIIIIITITIIIIINIIIIIIHHHRFIIDSSSSSSSLAIWYCFTHGQVAWRPLLDRCDFWSWEFIGGDSPGNVRCKLEHQMIQYCMINPIVMVITTKYTYIYMIMVNG
jgi:hypothetical protein